MRQEFSAKVRDQAAQRADGKCEKCGLFLGKKGKHFDHILPDALGGKPELANCQVLCEQCHKEKTSREDVPRIRKADRQRRHDNGSSLPSKQPIQSRGFAPRAPKPSRIGTKSDLSHLGRPEMARRFIEEE